MAFPEPRSSRQVSMLHHMWIPQQMHPECQSQGMLTQLDPASVKHARATSREYCARSELTVSQQHQDQHASRTTKEYIPIRLPRMHTCCAPRTIISPVWKPVTLTNTGQIRRQRGRVATRAPLRTEAPRPITASTTAYSPNMTATRARAS